MVCCLGLLAPMASAAENVWNDRDGLSVSVGVFLANYETEVRKSSGDTDGENISLEDDLGLDDDDEIPVVSIAFRSWERHKFFFSYMGMDRDAKEVLDEDLSFDGFVFPAGTQVETEYDIDMYRLGYSYLLVQNEEWELGLSAGAYWVNMDMKLDSFDGAISADYDESEPFPMLGFTASWLVSDDWLIRGTAEAFTIDMNDVEGDFYNVRLEAEYSLTQHLSIGAGYDLVRIDAEDTDKNNQVNYDYDGVLAYLRWRF